MAPRPKSTPAENETATAAAGLPVDAGSTDIHDPSDEKEDAEIAFTQGVLISSNGHECVVRPGQIIVVCREPGFRRSGIEHPSMHVYRRNELSKKQLEQMRSEPLLEIIEVG